MLRFLVVAFSLPGAFCGTRPASQPERRPDLRTVDFDAFRRQHLQNVQRWRKTTEANIEWLERMLRAPPH